MKRTTTHGISDLPCRRAAVLALVALQFVARPAHAEPAPSPPAAPSPARVAEAEAAFQEGRALLDEGHYQEACAKFEQSQALDRSPGTLLNLGNCYEAAGDLVRAFATFEQAFADSQQALGYERRELWSDAARERIASLGKRVPELRVRGLPDGASVALDARPVAARGALRVNPGEHVLEARAPGKRPFSVTITIDVGQRLAVNVPPLEPELGTRAATAGGRAPSSSAASAAPHDAEAQSVYGAWPWVLAGTGAALLGAGVVTGFAARSKSAQLADACGAKVGCDPSLESVQDSARSLALATDVLWITGAIAAGAGITLFVLESNAHEVSTAVQAGCLGAGCGLYAGGQF